MLRDTRVWLFVLALCLAGCARQNADALLIRVDAVEQALERPGELSLRGEGFPQGMRGEARLRGTLYAAGRAALPVELRAPCQALGSQKARVELADASAQVRGEGPFEGEVEVRFGTQADAQLVGRTQRALFRLGALPAIEEQFDLSQRAQLFQRALGIELIEQGEHGLSLSELSPNGLALRAGLLPRDAVLRMDGRPVQLVRDLVARDATREVLLEVKRAGESSSRVIRVASGQAAPTHDTLFVALSLLLGASCALAVLSALPTRTLWAPRRREYWLVICCLSCALALGLLVMRDLDPLLLRMSKALLSGALSATVFVCLKRRFRPTLRTDKDPELAPLL